MLHKGLLCRYSGYFNAALTGRFSEAQAGIVELRGLEPHIFKHFHDWLYTQKLPSIRREDVKEKQSPETFWDREKQEIVDLYAFGLCRICPELVNAVINMLVHKLPRKSLIPCAEYAYNNEATSGTPLCRLLVDKARQCTRQSLLERLEPSSEKSLEVHSAFANEILYAFFKHGSAPPAIEASSYFLGTSGSGRDTSTVAAGVRTKEEAESIV